MNKMLITSAGLAEIVNAEQSGTAPVVLSHVAFGTGQYTATADMTKLKSEFKRFDAVAGGAISDNMIHLTIHDNSTDAYTVNEVGVFTAGGTLFAVISQTTPIMEKSATSESMLAIDIALTDIDASSISFGDTNIVLNPATTETAGVVELATDAEAKTGTDTTRAMTPATAKAARDADANIVHRTGNETIAGSKTFTSNPAVKAVDPQFRFIQNDIVKGTKPETDQHSAVLFRDNADAAMGCIQNIYASDGSVHTRLGAYQPVAGSTSSVFLDMVYPASGDPYATAPTPAAGDNSTKIATTAWVNTKAANFLPLAGGTMSGTIIVKSGTAMRKNDEKSCVQICGGIDSSSSTLWLCGKEFSDNAFGQNAKGGFVLRAAISSDKYVHLLGLPDGLLQWDGKNIVRSVNGTAADAAGNVAITSVQNATNATNATHATTADSATKATQDGTGKVIADTYLPKSGGAMTADKAIYRNVNTGHLALYGGTGSNNDGAQLDLCGANHSSMPGTFQLHARTSDKDVILRGQTDGKLTWGDKYILTNSYVATVDNGAVMLTAGTQSVKGAYLRLYGADHSTGAGTFAIAASDGTTSKSLTGNADGSLKWAGDRVLTNEYYGTNSSDSIHLYSGASNNFEGAELHLCGADHIGDAGYGGFTIQAATSLTKYKQLCGFADGRLTWNNINISAMGMPSATYKDLTLGASGTKYTAPADGWFYLQKTAGSSGRYVSLSCGNIVVNQAAPGGDNSMAIFIPAGAGKECVLTYSATGTGVFRFIYAAGAKHLA